MKVKFLKHFTLLALLTISSVSLNGQGLVTLLPTNTTYTTAQSQDIQKIANDTHTTDYRLVQLGYLASNQVNGLLSFSIPGMETQNFYGQVELIENDDNGGTIWSGSIVGNTGSYFSFGSNAFSSTGYVKLQDKFYSFLPIGNGRCILVKHNATSYDNVACEPGEESIETANECNGEYEECSATIDILLLVTPEARDYLNGFDFWGLAIFSSMVNSSINQAFQNSDIPNKQVRIRSVEDFSLNVQSSPPKISLDIQHLVNDVPAQTLRDQYKADIVVLLTNRSYFSDGTQKLGRVSQINADNDHAYAIVEIPYMIAPNWVFAHEVAHLLGARHNRSSNGGDDDTNICAHARRFDDGDDIERSTLLAALTTTPENNPFSGEGNILYYSNPEVPFNGAATGTSDNNNAKAIRNTACGVAAYRSSPFFNVELAGLVNFCHPAPNGPPPAVQYSAVVNTPAIGNPGVGPYTYAWSWSPNPNFSPSYSLGNTQSITIGTPLACPNFYLRLITTSSDNITITRARFINSVFCPECEGQMLSDGGIKPSSIAGTPTSGQHSIQDLSRSNNNAYLDVSKHAGFTAYAHPNPSAGSLTIELSLENESDVQIMVTSANGSKILAINVGRLAAGVHSIPLSLESMTEGIYFCKVLAGKLPQTLKIVVTK